MTAERIAAVKDGDEVLRRCNKMIRDQIDGDTGYILILFSLDKGPALLEPILASNVTDATIKCVLQSGARCYGKTTYSLKERE